MCPFFVSGFGVLFRKRIFTYQNSSWIFRGYLCRPLSGVGEIEFFLQYPSNTPQYTTSDPYWMQNKLFCDIHFCMQNSLKMIIKIFSTIYLSLAVLFPSVLSYLHHESWVQKTETFLHDAAKTGSTSNRRFSRTIKPLRMIFNLIKLYKSA